MNRLVRAGITRNEIVAPIIRIGIVKYRPCTPEMIFAGCSDQLSNNATKMRIILESPPKTKDSLAKG